MRPQQLSRPTWVLSLALLCIATLVSSQAFGQATFIKYTAVGTINALADPTFPGLVFENSASEAKCTAAGIAPGAEMVTTIIIDPNTVDTDSDPALGVYPTLFIDISVGDGPVKLVAMRMTRDGTLATNYNNVVPGFEIFGPIDGVAWAGSEPVQVTGPSFLGFNSAPPSTPGAGDGKGMAMGLAKVPPGILSDDSLPTSLTLTDWNLYRLIAVNLLDVEEGDATIDVNATITSITKEMVSDPSNPVPILSPFGLLGLGVLLMGVSWVGVRRRARSALDQ